MNGLISNAQPINDNCNYPIELCPSLIGSFSNIGSSITFCPDCEDDFSFCFSPNNSIWFTFTTNQTGGSVELAFNNLLFENNPAQGIELQAAIIQAIVPCDAASYTLVGNCESNANSSFSLIANSLPPVTTYYVVVSGAMSGTGITLPAECTFDLEITGSGIERPVPSIALMPSSINLCSNSPFIATCSTTNCPNNSEYRWFINGNLVAITSDTVFTTAGLANGDIVSVETSCYTNCSEIVSAYSGSINVIDFTVDAGLDQEISENNDAQLNGFTTASFFYWSPSFGVSDSSILNPLIVTDETITYTLTAAESGCIISDQVIISITKKLFIPTTFSPNADKINDTWIIEGIEEYPNCLVRIFNRWGQEVYQTTSYSEQKSWDGTIRGEELPEGVYYYTIDLREQGKEELLGSITLLR